MLWSCYRKQKKTLKNNKRELYKTRNSSLRTVFYFVYFYFNVKFIKNNCLKFQLLHIITVCIENKFIIMYNYIYNYIKIKKLFIKFIINM